MSDKWHDDYKKAIAEKWVQCPQIEARAEELRQKWATGQIGISALCKAHAHAENEIAELKAELADARAEVERLKTEADKWRAEAKSKNDARLNLESAAESIKYWTKRAFQKDKLIEQMRGALKACEEKICHGVWSDGNDPEPMHKLLDALEAAERGE